MNELHCQVCHCKLDLNAETMICEQIYCQKVSLIRQNLRERIAVYVEHFSDHIPNEETYKEYLEKTDLEEQYKAFAGIVDEDSTPKCSRRVWFQTNIASVHQLWPDERGHFRGEIIHD